MSLRALAVVSLAFFLSALTIGCGFFVDQQVTSLQVTPATASVAPGASVSLNAAGVNNDGTITNLANVNWASSNPQVATVSNTGVVTGVSEGTTTITATSGSLSGTANLTVSTTNTGGLTISPAGTTVSISTGTVQFTATSNGQDVTGSTTWSSSNTAVANFSGVTGAATLVGQGTTTITGTATVNGSAVTGTTTLTVGP